MHAVEEVMKRTGAAIGEAAISAAIVEDADEDVIGSPVREISKDDIHGMSAEKSAFTDVLAWASTGNTLGKATQYADTFQVGVSSAPSQMQPVQPAAGSAHRVASARQAAAESATAQEASLGTSEVDWAARRIADEKEAAEWAA